MGGIAGIICSNTVSEDSISDILEKMLRSIIHRGIDDRGTAFIANGGLGQSRHAIVDIRSGQQPFHHPEKPYILVFDGEIYNYKALRAKLEAKGVDFVTRSDTEVLMMMYDYYDEDMFSYLEGTYAFALWNGEKKELLIVRDPLGQKPLYYEMDEHGIAFASELKAILQARQSRPSINEVALQTYLALQYIPSPMTMFEGIFKIPPGYMLRWRIQDESLEVWPIWVPDDEVSKTLVQCKNITMEEALAQFGKQFQHSLQLQTESTDVPVGLFLSGGLDSAVLGAQASKLVDYPLHTFSVGYTYSKSIDDERVQAQKIAKTLGTTHHEMELGPNILDQLPRILWHLDEPLADPTVLTMDALSQAAGEHVKVVLTGHGADEIFGSSPQYRKTDLLLTLSKTPALLRKLLAVGVGGLSISALGWEGSHVLQGLLNNVDPLATWQTYRNFPEIERRKLLKPGEGFPDRRFRVFSNSAFDPYLQLQWDELHHGLPHNLLLGLDKMTMAHNVEARTPYLDHHLAAWTLGLPETMKWHNASNKYLLREYAKQFLPQDILRTRQKTCEIPLDAWLYPQLDNIRNSLLGSALFADSGLFSVQYIEKLLNAYESGKLRSAQPIWNLIILKVWYEVFTRCTTKDDLWDLQPLGRSC